jgi:hypothetical protein
MGEFVITSLIFFGIISVTAVIFGVWVVGSVLKWLVTGIFGTPQRRVQGRAVPQVRCVRRGCAAENPVTARFCRRCGLPLPAAEQVSVRRAAMW